MAKSIFNNVKILGLKTVIPERYIDIDDELEFFDNNPKKLLRAKKMIGYGRRYIADEYTTVTDMAVDAAEKLFSEMHYDRNKIDLLIFVNQKPDYMMPADACLAHGRLNLKQDCASIDILLGCSGYVYALWTAMALMQAGSIKSCLLLAGDIASYKILKENRKAAQVFGDAASATILEYQQGAAPSFFILGTDGQGWDKIVNPFGGIRLPLSEVELKSVVIDNASNPWNYRHGIMQGEDVFNFSTEVAPKIIKDLLKYAQEDINNIDYFAIHQANKQIVETIIEKTGISKEKASAETFAKFANNSTNSVVTVLCDQLQGKDVKKVVICTFGVGLSWGCCLVSFNNVYNGGISTFVQKNKITREEQIKYWNNFFKGEK